MPSNARKAPKPEGPQEGVPENWHEKAEAAVRKAKQQISLRLDPDVIAYFKSTGQGWQGRLNAALQSYKDHMLKVRK